MHPGQQSQPPPQSTPSIATSSALGPPQTPQQVPPTSAAAFPPHGAPPAAATGGPFMHPGHHPGAPAAGSAPFGHMQPPPQHPGAQLPPHHPAAARMPGAPYGGPQMPHHHQQAPTSMGSAQFPPNSLEATATRSAFNRRRAKLAARDYAGITTRQLCMALRSGQEMEVVFALNALTALLYDDTQWPPLQLANEPQLLTLALEHLRATLAVLYPKGEFDAEAFDELPLMKARMEKGKEEAVARKLALVDAAKYRPTEAEKVAGSSTRPKTHESAPIASTSALSSKITPPNHVVGNYTLRTRSGKRVYVEPRAKRPMALDRLYEELKEDTPNGTPENGDLSFAELRLQMETGTGSSIADRMFRCLRTRLNARRALSKPKGSLADVIAEKNAGVNKENEEELEVDATTPKIEKGGPEFFYREAHPWEVWDRFAKPDCSLLPRQAPVQERDPALQELADRALCLSNIVRGFALIPGNEPLMHANRPLLHLAGRLLMLMVGEDEQQRVAREQLAAGTSAAEKPKASGAADVKKEPESDAMEVDATAAAQPTAKPAEGEPTLSQFTDLYALESEISEPLLDALLHWAVTTNVQAQDPIAPGLISPRAYVFEIVSKYSLLERNVDLLLSTGSWPRLEEFVRVVCSFITMTEDPPIREFAIVILNAISVASESVCLVAAQQTNAIHNLISFLEVADQNMATIASTSGLDALRDNPEQIGTSIPMLRRAAQILVNFVHHELCRGPFKTHENKLLSLTVSHVMDSQVANKLTSVLYEIQQLPATKEPKQNEISDDDYERLAAMFPSCTWRISDDEQPLPPAAFLPAAPLPAFQPADVKPPAFNGLFGPSGVNGIEAMPVNGSAKPRRKRLHCHPDGRPMTALERELLRDSDAESVDGDEEAVGGLDNGGHSAPPPAHEPPHLKTASESHEHEELLQQQQAAAADEPEAKRTRIVGNGVISPKCNGDLKVRPAGGQTNAPTKAENGTPPTQSTGSGSMQAVA
ncbi:hypothetical protein M3Y99_01099600 [Aphelenchoides fujianensis]|nr:hypothetical protein M3Y99_01099600 [Aphelenchoides fujianensis]